MKTQIFKSYIDFLQREDKKINGVSEEFAAMCIFSASSPIKVSPTKFYLGNKESMEDIIKCAKEESDNAL